MGDPGDRGAYRFGPFQLDVRERRLSRGTDVIPLRLKVFDTLCVLVENAGRLVTKDELLAAVWPDTTVEENNLNHNISVLRKALGEKATGQQYIETVPRVGYRFVAPVETAERETRAPAASVESRPTRFAPAPVGSEPGPPRLRHRHGHRCRDHAVSWRAPAHPGALRPSRTRTASSIADFVNTTGDEVFDGTLRQAVAVELGQSPFLNVVSEERVRETLRYIGRSPDERVTRDVAREIAQRQGVKVLLLGSIASLGRHYVINLEAVSAASGETVAREHAEAESRETILVRLGEAATRLREKLGESLASIEKFSAPIEQATTIVAWTRSRPTTWAGRGISAAKYFEAIPLYRRAVELDPDFAMAYAALGITYGMAREYDLAAQFSQRAFELRDRVSEREKFYISAALLHGRARRRRSSHRGAGAVEADLSSRLRAPHEPVRALRRDRTLPGGARRSARGRPPEPGRRCRVRCRREHVDQSRPIGGGGGGRSSRHWRGRLDRRISHYMLYAIALLQDDAAAAQQQIDRVCGNSGRGRDAGVAVGHRGVRRPGAPGAGADETGDGAGEGPWPRRGRRPVRGGRCVVGSGLRQLP